MGKLLTEFEHGLWMKWLEAKCIHQKQAERWMRITGELPNSTPMSNSVIKVLSLLAQDSTPESARQEVIDKAENGEKVTYADAQELVKTMREIESLEIQLKATRSQMASLSAINQIAVLQQKLKEKMEAVVNDVEVEKIPDDYESLQREHASLTAEIVKMEAEKDKAVMNGVKAEINKLDKVILEKQNLVESIESRVNELREARRQIDKNVEIEEAYKAADKEITAALYRVAIVLKDVLEDYPMPEKFEQRFKKYAVEMQNGINYINSYFELGEI